MITNERYQALKDKENRHLNAAYNGFCEHPPLTAKERAAVEVYEFVQNAPDKAVVYIKREVIPGSIATRKVVVTTIDGATLGYGVLHVPYHIKRRIRYQLEFTAINGTRYKGTYYGNLNYANVRKCGKAAVIRDGVIA